MKKILLSSALCATILYGDAANVLPADKRTFDQSKYIPDISVILDASYVQRNKSNDVVSELELPGVAHGLLGSHAHGEHNHASYNANQGFNLNYAELVLSSNVDPFLTMDAVFHFDEHGVEIEEAYFTTTALGNGLRFRGGKMFSNFGYLNAQHHHYWDFGDMPLVYEAFLGMHGINELGAQIQWTAPTPFYLMAGFEVLQGTNEQMFGNETMRDANDDVFAEAKDAPSLYVGYIKTSADVGDTTFFGGLSYAQGTARIDHTEDEHAPHAFSGTSKLYGADFVVLHALDSYSSIKWQTEWLSRDMDGKSYMLDDTTRLLTGSADTRKKQTGLYSQLIYTYDTNWKMGVRYDTIYQNDVKINGVKKSLPNDFQKYSAMVEYHTSEFARFRLQYNHNESLYDGNDRQKTINTIMLQANIAIGAHGAHSF
ncbi:MAG: hypothetical protein RBR59_00010 [Sulfurimonadaceae bacterium]|jgi:hypothetical protein|nr:hypothetical protein [Sulfurimonadaceae bacterium]